MYTNESIQNKEVNSSINISIDQNLQLSFSAIYYISVNLTGIMTGSVIFVMEETGMISIKALIILQRQRCCCCCFLHMAVVMLVMLIVDVKLYLKFQELYAND